MIPFGSSIEKVETQQHYHQLNNHIVSGSSLFLSSNFAVSLPPLCNHHSLINQYPNIFIASNYSGIIYLNFFLDFMEFLLTFDYLFTLE